MPDDNVVEGDVDEVQPIEPDTEGKIQPDKDGKYPKVVPWGKYVGTKESLGNKLQASLNKVASLEEQLKTAIKLEDHQKLQNELETAKTTLQNTQAELTKVKEASTSEKREFLKGKGVSEEKVNAMSEEALVAAIDVLGGIKQKLDLGGGGGGTGELKGSPMELARQAYTK